MYHPFYRFTSGTAVVPVVTVDTHDGFLQPVRHQSSKRIKRLLKEAERIVAKVAPEKIQENPETQVMTQAQDIAPSLAELYMILEQLQSVQNAMNAPQVQRLLLLQQEMNQAQYRRKMFILRAAALLM